jgi:hypothetical protein
MSVINEAARAIVDLERCHNNQTYKCVLRLEVVLSVHFYDHVLGNKMNVSGKGGVLFENKAKSTELC